MLRVACDRARLALEAGPAPSAAPTEINVFTPGGLGSAQRFTGVDFAEVVIDDLERKIAARDQYHRRLGNSKLAAL